MAIIMQAQQVTSTRFFRVATTIADAVRMDPESDYWLANLAEGLLVEAHVQNRISADKNVCGHDYMTMKLCTKHGRMFQVQS